MQLFLSRTSLIGKKRFLCMVLSCVMLFTMVGCQKNEDPPSTGSTTGQTDPQQSSTSTEQTDPTTEQLPLSPAVTGAVYNLTPDIAYKFGLVQEVRDGTVYYLNGKMNAAYLDTTADIEEAADVFIETTEGGFFIYVVTGETKQYISIKENDGRVSCAYESSASTVFTLHMGSVYEENYHAGAPVTTINGQKYCLGVRSDSPHTTMGPRSIAESNYYGEFYGEVIAAGCDWIAGVWQNVERTDTEFSGELWVDEYVFDSVGTGSLGGCGYTSWDLEKGEPGNH